MPGGLHLQSSVHFLFLSEWMNEREARMEEGEGGQRGQREERLRVWRGIRGPRGSQLSALGFRGKAESEREIAGRLSHSTGVNNRKQFCFPLLGRNQKPFCPAAFCVQAVVLSCWQSLPPSRWAACVLAALTDSSPQERCYPPIPTCPSPFQK